MILLCLQILYTFIGISMQHYKIVTNFANTEKCSEMADKLDQLFASGKSLKPDNQCIISPAFYKVFDDELEEFLPIVENLVGKKLFPTYNYARIYKPGEILLPHTDRNACEYSVTLTLKYDTEIWPIYLQLPDETVSALLEVGDAMVYKGIEHLHWRMRLVTQYHYQAFFHYVDQEGPYANEKYDSTKQRKLNVL